MHEYCLKWAPRSWSIMVQFQGDVYILGGNRVLPHELVQIGASGFLRIYLMQDTTLCLVLSPSVDQWKGWGPQLSWRMFPCRLTFYTCVTFSHLFYFSEVPSQTTWFYWSVSPLTEVIRPALNEYTASAPPLS